MAKVDMSTYLSREKGIIKKLVDKLSKKYEYVSILGTDVLGKGYGVQRTGISIDDSMWTERGFVARIYNGINYSEFSFNEICEENLDSIIEEIDEIAKKDKEKLEQSSLNIYEYPIIEEEKVGKNFYGEVSILPSAVGSKGKIQRLIKMKNLAFDYSKLLVDFKVYYEEVQVSKVFISTNKELEQSYIWSQGYLVPIVRRNENTKVNYKSFAGLKGVELIDEMEKEVTKVIDETVELLDAERMIPGEYDVICTPEIAGLIAHEAFGHGVEMDMFVKDRAKAVEYLGKQVASELVIMHDGAKSAENVSSYLFDDEGVLGTDTIVIRNGVLETGISDSLSALRLGKVPTGNGKRESFERKAYTRMTNTFFSEGNDKLDDMISSIGYGFLLDGAMSGMEDPKNWGIQCMLLKAKEIKNGKFTGKIFSPIIMTGYVPDLLKSISMVSDKVEIFGSGACGKGYKEFVKVSDGGPYIKAKARLG